MMDGWVDGWMVVVVQTDDMEACRLNLCSFFARVSGLAGGMERESFVRMQFCCCCCCFSGTVKVACCCCVSVWYAYTKVTLIRPEV